MRRSITLVGVLLLVTIRLNAQVVYPTESEKDIYWQPGVRIDYSDYQSTDKKDCLKFNEKYGMKMSASIAFRGVVDVPKKRGKYDRFYLAPAFCKNCSCILSEDSVNLKVDRLALDFAELCVRGARKELLELRKEMNTDNTYTMFLTTIKNKWDERMRSFFGTVYAEVYVDKKEGAYESWRKFADSLLVETAPYMTKPEDCYRFVLGEPIEKGYKEPESIMGDLRSKKDEE